MARIRGKALQPRSKGRGFFLGAARPTQADPAAVALRHSTDNAFMLWVKAFHIVFVSSWFAALFYLPRIFVNLAQVAPDSVAERERLLGMSRRLWRFGVILMTVALVLGAWLWLGWGIGRGQAWMHAKLALVSAALVYQWVCLRILRRFETRQPTLSERALRAFNEVAVLLFAVIVVLVVVKPW